MESQETLMFKRWIEKDLPVKNWKIAVRGANGLSGRCAVTEVKERQCLRKREFNEIKSKSVYESHQLVEFGNSGKWNGVEWEDKAGQWETSIVYFNTKA